MAAPQQAIPLAYLPRLAETASMLSRLFGSASLLLLLGLDAWRSKNKKTHWIPGYSLVLGALSLQLLGLLSHPVVNISDSEELNADSVIKMYEQIFNNIFQILSGRLVICIFIGNMLPEVARSRKRNVWSDMLALAIFSSAGVLIHISYEIYILLVNYSMSMNGSRSWIVWYLFTNIIMFTTIVLLVLLLGCAALTSKSIHQVVARRIPVLLSKSENRNPGSVVWSETVEEHAVRSWITVRTHQPQYIITRSVVISSIGFLVTICTAFGCAFSIYPANLLHVFSVQYWGVFTWFVFIADFLQLSFILVGWAMVCWRWLMAVVFYPRLLGKDALSLKQYFRVEDFWKRAILEWQEEFMEWDIESVKSLSFLNKFLVMFIQKLRLYKLLPVLLHLQILLVLMSKTCWLISEMVFSNHYMQSILMGQASHEFLVLYNLHNDGGLIGPINHGDFVKYLDALMYMPGENPAGVWIANLKFVQDMKARLTEAESYGKNCKALISLLEKTTMQKSTDWLTISQRKLQVENDFNMGKSSAKMTVVSLLAIIIELSAFYQEYGGCPAGPSDTVERCIESCWEAWGIMELVENSNLEAALVSKQADTLFRSLKKSHKWLNLSLPINNFEARTVEAAKKALQGLADTGKHMANGGCISSTGYDSKNWKAIIAGNNLYTLCENINSRSNNIEEMLDAIERLLADVIGSCMFKLEQIIVDHCRFCVEGFMEEKLWDVFYEAWKAKGVIHQLPPGIKFGRYFVFQFERLHSF